MSKTVVLSIFLVLSIGFGVALGSYENGPKKQLDGEQPMERPNIIIIMADDLGFSDLGCYGGEIETPNLDRLAFNGVRSTAFYNTSRCCPTRASLLTGLYPHQAGLGRMTMDTGLPGYRGSLQPNTITLAEVLQGEGYQTGMVGKWHVSETVDLGGKKQLDWLAHQAENGPFSGLDSYPTARGFEKFYGNIWGVVDYFDPFSLVNGSEPVKSVPENYYHTTAIGDSAVAYVEKFSKKSDPFFLYVAHCAPHWPLQAPEEVVQKYLKVYQKGWRAIRKARFERLRHMGLLSKGVELPDFMFPEKDWDSNSDKAWDARAMAVHAAMIEVMDKSVGKLLSRLEASGELENTLILFLSDNGASAERPSKYGPGFDRAGSTRDGSKVDFPVGKDVMPGAQTVVSGIGPVWAHVVNTPFRYWKARVYEGGINTPFIAFWPRGIKDKGAVRETPAHVTDIMATCVDVSGSKYPQTFKGHAITPTPGRSIIPILTGRSKMPTQPTFFWEHFGAKALRKANWKLVKLDGQSPWELYNLSSDKTEVYNLAENNEERVKEMQEEWEGLAHKYKVFPAPN